MTAATTIRAYRLTIADPVDVTGTIQAEAALCDRHADQVAARPDVITLEPGGATPLAPCEHCASERRRSPRTERAMRQVIAEHDGYLELEGDVRDGHGEIRVLTEAGALMQREVVPMTAHMRCGPGERVQAGTLIAEVEEETA